MGSFIFTGFTGVLVNMTFPVAENLSKCLPHVRYEIVALVSKEERILRDKAMDDAL